MTPNRAASCRTGLGLLLAALTAVILSACGGGGGSNAVTITSINLNPGTPAAGTVVTLSASITAPGGNAGSLTKAWNVSAGTLSLTPPDFSLVLRDTARAASADTISTTQANVYWLVPATAGSATISLAVDSATRTREVSFGASPVTLSVSDGENNAKICTIAVNDVEDLYQAAFRVNFSSAWEPIQATPGAFLGAESDILFFDMTNQTGFVPVAITRKGSAAGVDGDGVLATITFAPAAGSSSASREAADAASPFGLGRIMLRSSADAEIR